MSNKQYFLILFFAASIAAPPQDVLLLLLLRLPMNWQSVSAFSSSSISNHHHPARRSRISLLPEVEALSSRSTTTTTTRRPMAIDDDYDGEDEDEDENENEISYSYNPIEHETPEERTSRMELVRKLQKSFYQDEEPIIYIFPTTTTNGDDNDNDNNDNSGSGTIIENLPLWRVQWTELPGSQNILNVHVPHYTNMFQKILRGKSTSWGDDDKTATAAAAATYDDDNDNDNDNDNDDHHDLYFGHLFLPGGSENLDNEEYALNVGETGVLMKICDCRQQMDDGRLTIIVQALERFKVHKAIRSHSPYAIADVEIDPDQEQIIYINNNNNNEIDIDDNIDDDEGRRRKKSKAIAVAEAFAYHPFEFRTVSMEECQVSKNGQVGVGISPLSNYDATKALKRRRRRRDDDTADDHQNDDDTDDDNNNNKNNNNNATKATAIINNDLVAVTESNTWIKLDELLKLLRIASQGVAVPVPTQLLGLLPRLRCIIPDDHDHKHKHDGGQQQQQQQQRSRSSVMMMTSWPSDFYLEKVVANMEGKFSELSAGNYDSNASSSVGTYSKSPFVRVDDYSNNDYNYNDNDDNDDNDNDVDADADAEYEYSSLRIAQRLSYVIWTITESISLPDNTDDDRYSRQNVLEIDSTKERLELATEKMDKICILLRQVLKLQG